MVIEARQINATVEIEVIEVIWDMAKAEKRSFSNMVAVLLEEAIAKRNEQSHKTEKQHA